jgi:hypothetical protein
MDVVPEHLIPRDLSRDLEGGKLRIVPELSDGPDRVAITSLSPLTRASGYVESLEAEAIEIVPHYTEAGWYCEANVVALSDGKRKAIFVPVQPVEGAMPVSANGISEPPKA